MQGQGLEMDEGGAWIDTATALLLHYLFCLFNPHASIFFFSQLSFIFCSSAFAATPYSFSLSHHCHLESPPPYLTAHSVMSTKRHSSCLPPRLLTLCFNRIHSLESYEDDQSEGDGQFMPSPIPYGLGLPHPTHTHTHTVNWSTQKPSSELSNGNTPSPRRGADTTPVTQNHGNQNAATPIHQSASRSLQVFARSASTLTD